MAPKTHPGPRERDSAADATEAFQARVAETVKRLRKERGWTLDELARRSGVSRAMLSQVEAKKTNPTIALLWKISTAFSINFSAMLGEEAGKDVTIIRRGEMQVLSSADGKFVSRPLFPRSGVRKAELYELRLAPGARTEGPPHPPGTRENLVVVRGKLIVWVSGAPFEIPEGDSIDFAADVVHGYENPGGKEFLGYEVIEYRSIG